MFLECCIIEERGENFYFRASKHYLNKHIRYTATYNFFTNSCHSCDETQEMKATLSCNLVLLNNLNKSFCSRALLHC